MELLTALLAEKWLLSAFLFLWGTLERKYPALAANQPYLVKSAKLTRLQAGNFATRADAETFCAKVRSASQPCVVMRSK